MNTPLKRGSTIGILGGGQLGRMLSMAGADLSYKSCVYCPDEGSCAFDVASSFIQKPYDDEDALREFVERCDVITTEFENVPLKTIDILERVAPLKPFYPGRKALATSQDRLLEKRMAVKLGIKIPDYRPFSSKDERPNILYPAMVKKRSDGYDGKGQSEAFDLHQAQRGFEFLGNVPCIIERKVDFEFEISVTVVCGIDGSVRMYEPFENVHKGGILTETTWPMDKGRLREDQLVTASGIAKLIADELKVIGVITVEMFVTKEAVLFNEIAPRPHNTAHITRDCAITSQFHNHIRAITGNPLGDTRPFARGKMVNLLGENYSLNGVMNDSVGRPYFYNKADRKGRKVGHAVYVEPLD